MEPTAPERTSEPFRDRKMKVYRAEDRARMTVPAALLDGTEKDAQAYVDRITRSTWWAQTCPPSWRGDHDRAHPFLNRDAPPKRVWVFITRGEGARAMGHVCRKPGYRGWAPSIRLGKRAGRDNPAYATDPWIILHELAHIMAMCHNDHAREKAEAGHGRIFASYFMKLVRRWLGPDAARALREAYRIEGVKYTARRTP